MKRTSGTQRAQSNRPNRHEDGTPAPGMAKLGGELSFHPYAWLLWIGAAALAGLLTRNPLYLILVGVGVGLVFNALPGRETALAANWLGLVKLGALLTAFAVPMNALTVHSGRLILFTLPPSWPVIGGPITGEAVLFGVSTSLSLTVILLSFATLNVALDQSQLLRLVPPFLLEAGVVVAIAVGFIPQMVRSFHEIREAQTLRGHRFDGPRQWGPLFVALLTTGLERSLTLAESMESRGFGGERRTASARQGMRAQIGVLAALGGMAVGLFVAQFRPAWQPWAWTTVVVAVMGLGGILWRQGRRAQRTTYSRRLWRRRDTVLAGVAGILLLALASIRLAWPEMLIYYPYPPASPWPDFNLLVGALLLLIAAPVWIMPSQPAPPQSPAREGQMASTTAPSLGTD